MKLKDYPNFDEFLEDEAEYERKAALPLFFDPEGDNSELLALLASRHEWFQVEGTVPLLELLTDEEIIAVRRRGTAAERYLADARQELEKLGEEPVIRFDPAKGFEHLNDVASCLRIVE